MMFTIMFGGRGDVISEKHGKRKVVDKKTYF